MEQEFKVGDFVKFKVQALDRKDTEELIIALEYNNLGNGIFTIKEIGEIPKLSQEALGHSQMLVVESSNKKESIWSGSWFKKNR
jgi:exosome complex RNA-binding protein Rrp4